MPKRKKKLKRELSFAQPADIRQPFIEHIMELRRRLFYVVVSMVAWSAAAYGLQQQMIAILLKPAEGQDFIYTTPGGGIDFLFRICLYTGFICSVPVIIYQLLKYLEPLIASHAFRFVATGTIVSGILAGLGVIFGYFVGLPSALHFLMHQFTTSQVTAMVTISSYMSFVLIYLLGSALLLQVPLILIFINKIKPLSPRRLMRHQSWVILGAFILGAIISPTPDIMNQLMLAVPMILMYQIGVIGIAIANRPKRSKKVTALLARDAEIQAERLAGLRTVWQETETAAADKIEAVVASLSETVETEMHDLQATAASLTAPAPQPVPVPIPIADAPAPIRPRNYASTPRALAPRANYNQTTRRIVVN